MRFYLYKVSGYEEAIMSLRMSKGKHYSWEKAQEIQDLVYVCTNKQGFLAEPEEWKNKYIALGYYDPAEAPAKGHKKLSGYYEKDIEEFKRLLGLVLEHGMGKFDHHTLIKYIDISFFTDGLHRGGQDLVIC